MDAGAIAGFLTGLKVYLDDPAKVKRLLLPTKLSTTTTTNTSVGKMDLPKDNTNSPSLMNLLMGVKVLQQAIIDLLLDIMVECCQPSDERESPGPCNLGSKSCPNEHSEDIYQRLDRGSEENNRGYAVQSSDLPTKEAEGKISPVRPCFPSDSSVEDLSIDDGLIRSKVISSLNILYSIKFGDSAG